MSDANPVFPHPFVLQRDEDVSGVSGTGIVAGGCLYPDGVVTLRWYSDWPTSVVFHDRGIEAVEKIHGHDGRTRIVWKDRSPVHDERLTSKFANDPIFYHSPEEQGTKLARGWYFYEETWSDVRGPFSSEETAEYALEVYARNL